MKKHITRIKKILNFLIQVTWVAGAIYIGSTLYTSITGDYQGAIVEKWSVEHQSEGKSGAKTFTTFYLKITEDDGTSHTIPVAKPIYDRFSTGEKVKRNSDGIVLLESRSSG